ncbi:MAG TPA: hypothetical protein VLY23_18395 [Candidatus Acidoferrum sp.]|nr:hypothetical protein [Candidatus Acidoferrum sp.]
MKVIGVKSFVALLCALAFVTLLLPLPAYADTFVSYDLTATLQSGSLSGQFTYDEQTGAIRSADIVFTDGSSIVTFTCPVSVNGPCSIGGSASQNSFNATDLTNMSNILGLVWSRFPLTSPPSSFSFIAPSNVLVGGARDYVVSGNAVLTPEPAGSTLLSLGLSFLILAGFRRCKHTHQS